MSRIGYKPIKIPEKVIINLEKNSISVEGPKGTESAPLFPGIIASLEKDFIYFKREETLDSENTVNPRKLKALHGLVRSLVNNCIIGTTEGFKKELEIKGVGYRASQKGKDIQFQLGFSHEVIFKVPEGITVNIKTPTELEVTGTNKEKVGQVASDIRTLKKPEPYKGKGIRYKNEHINMKAGKAGKK
jgi:large subunit ribosomal protein L6